MNQKIDFPGFVECIKLIRSDDPMTYEDGYHLLLPEVQNYGDRIADLIRGENNPKIKARFVELLGLCNNPKYIPLFVELLHDSDHNTVAWALTNLEALPKGKDIAGRFRYENPKWLE